MQPVSLPPQVPVGLPVGQGSPEGVPTLLLDDLSQEVWRRNADQVIRTQLPAPHGPVDALQLTLQNMVDNLEKVRVSATKK